MLSICCAHREWEAYEERCIKFIANSRGIEEHHELVHIENLTTAIMQSVLFPKVHQLQVDSDDDDDFLLHASQMTVEQALAHLGLTELPSSPRQLYMATYARFKEADTTDNEDFPSKQELREARERIKAALDP